MNYQYIDMETYKRRSHFEYFNSLEYPYVGTTSNVDISTFLEKVKKEKLPFFFSFCYNVSKAANSVPQFRQRIIDGKIIEFQYCQTSHTVALEDGTFCYCTLNADMPFEDYIAYATEEQEKAKRKRSIEDDGSLSKLFISTLPWLSFTSLVQPVPIPADSNPRITWGRYFEQEGKVLMPVTVLCNHALIDGLHIAAFYEALERSLG